VTTIHPRTLTHCEPESSWQPPDEPPLPKEEEEGAPGANSRHWRVLGRVLFEDAVAISVRQLVVTKKNRSWADHLSYDRTDRGTLRDTVAGVTVSRTCHSHKRSPCKRWLSWGRACTHTNHWLQYAHSTITYMIQVRTQQQHIHSRRHVAEGKVTDIVTWWLEDIII